MSIIDGIKTDLLIRKAEDYLRNPEPEKSYQHHVRHLELSKTVGEMLLVGFGIAASSYVIGTQVIEGMNNLRFM